MNTTTFSNALLPLAGTDGAIQSETANPSFFSRVLAALVKSREAQANREIARLEAAYGFRLRFDSEDLNKVSRQDLPFQN